MPSFNSQRQSNLSWSGIIATLLVQALVLLALLVAVVRYLEWSSDANQAEFMSATKPSASDPKSFRRCPAIPRALFSLILTATPLNWLAFRRAAGRPSEAP